MATVCAKLLRAVAEAADGHRTGEDVFVVACEDVVDELRVFTSAQEAEDFRDAKGGNWQVFGPYVTDGEPIAAKQITRVRLYFDDGSEEELSSNDVEAVFLTLSAIDRFLIPYYTRVRGVEYAAQMRADYLKGIRNLCCKGPMSLIRE
jgi:hypothetical protein